ncbi:MAG TPA: RluA family pseudouridine synthase [Chloroflexi bacterium]|nr:RluA family pseudouridine synthase [Chloroflexota bacterium]
MVKTQGSVGQSEQGSGSVYCLTVERQSAGLRVDRFVATQVHDLSRSAVQRLIVAGEVRLNGQPVTASTRVRTGDKVKVRIPPPEAVDLAVEAIPLDIVYEDRDLVVINKSAGIVVHPGVGHIRGTLVNAILAHCPDLSGVGGELRPGIVHRLDRDTSGLIVIAKHERALRDLQRQFKQRLVRKHYTALVCGFVRQASGIVEAPIGRHRIHRKRMAVRGDGKPARTRWHILRRLRDDRGHDFTLVDVQLLTGRTHQIRVHMAWMGYPLAGDSVYGTKATASFAPRQFLHARELSFDHPVSGEHLHFQADLPEDLKLVLAHLRTIDDVS